MRRGEVWMASLGAVRGSEQAGTRPVMILQAEQLNAFLTTVVVVPFTTNARWAQFPFCVAVTVGEGGLTADSVALCHQVRVLDRSRLIRQLGQVTDPVLDQIERAVQVTLGM